MQTKSKCRSAAPLHFSDVTDSDTELWALLRVTKLSLGMRQASGGKRALCVVLVHYPDRPRVEIRNPICARIAADHLLGLDVVENLLLSE